MCGRYALYGPAGLPPRTLRVPEDEWRLAPRYNVAPSQPIPVIRECPRGERHVIQAHWGLVPGWAESPEALKHHSVNARCEGVESKPMFKWAFRHSRVLVPASGFYEWQSVAGTKQPWFIRRRDGEPMAFAGLLEHWHRGDRELWTVAILTTTANALVRPIHDRMPVIIAPENFDAWLDPENKEPAALLPLLVPFPDDEILAYRVHPRVGNPKSDDPGLIDVMPEP